MTIPIYVPVRLEVQNRHSLPPDLSDPKVITSSLCETLLTFSRKIYG
jgi:hypothetical protein